MITENTHCFHCQESIPKGLKLYSTIEGKTQAMCCIGCQAIADTIIENGLGDYYRFRTEPATKSESLVPKQLKQQVEKKKLLDDAALQDEFTTSTNEYKETVLTVEGISCAACAWLIEKQLTKLPGLINITVNASSQRATVQWQSERLQLSDILIAIDAIGYQALPFKANKLEEINKKQTKAFIKRLGISGILMMQIMMIAIGLYFGAFSDMSPHNLTYLRWISLLLTLPIVFYGAIPFYRSAYRALKVKHLSMDVPVSIAILLAFFASAWGTIFEQGEVYFESVAMFTFLLLVGKFLEFNTRSKAAKVSANLLKLMPLTATKIHNNIEEFIVARKLQAKDTILIKPGEVIAADGLIINGNSQVNEAMLSGEQLPVDKSIGSEVFAGTVNGDGNIIVEVKHNNQQSFLSQLIQISEKAQAYKPKLARLSDKIAQYFIAIILLSALVTAIYWQQYLPKEAFWITISVLVATCPCALSLATPTALTCATSRLNKGGIMIKSGHVLESMPSVDCFAFDKTGTLTSGDFSVEHVEIFDNTFEKKQILSIISALELHSEHPIAKAFIPYRDHEISATNVKVLSGKGVTGEINQQLYQVGQPSWLLANKKLTNEQLTKDNRLAGTLTAQFQQAQCLLTVDNELVAAIYLVDEIRPDAKPLMAQLSQEKLTTIMLSGDNQTGCDKVQTQLKLNHIYCSLTANEKLTKLEQFQQGHTLAMVGDGINDTPVFAAAHVSIAMGSGTEIAKTNADVILMANQLKSVNILRNVAVKTRRIIWQNYIWALGYNCIALPLAISGHVTPYMAVIGMSISSLLVVSNSLRLLKTS